MPWTFQISSTLSTSLADKKNKFKKKKKLSGAAEPRLHEVCKKPQDSTDARDAFQRVSKPGQVKDRPEDRATPTLRRKAPSTGAFEL